MPKGYAASYETADNTTVVTNTHTPDTPSEKPHEEPGKPSKPSKPGKPTKTVPSKTGDGPMPWLAGLAISGASILPTGAMLRRREEC